MPPRRLPAGSRDEPMDEHVNWRTESEALFAALSDADVEATEKAIGRKLPDSLLTFLRERNGALFPRQPYYVIHEPLTAGGFEPTSVALVRIYGATASPQILDRDAI